jgi:MFS family permease
MSDGNLPAMTDLQARPAAGSAEPRLVTARFVSIVAAALAYFVGFAMLMPTLPRYVEGELDGSKVAVGVVVGAFGLSAAALRPLIGTLGDRYGRRILFVTGAAVSAVSVLGYPLLASIPVLVALRMVTGLGEASAFVGAATAAQDLAPDHRRAEAASYFSLAVYVGMGIGPLLGEHLARQYGFDTVCLVAGGLCATSAIIARSVPRDLGRHPGASLRPKQFLHPAAVRPGILLSLSLLGFSGFTAFVALYLDDLTGNGNAGPIFLMYAATVLVLRLAGARVPDRLGPRRTGTIAFSTIALGLLVLATWPAVEGVYVGTLVMALGIAFSFPSLFALMMRDVPDTQRSHAIASFSFFFDLPNAIGAPLLGLVVHLTDYRVAFAVGSCCAVAGLVGLRRLTDPGPSSVTRRLPTAGPHGA